MTVRRHGSGSRARSDAPGVAVWSAVLAVSVTLLGGVSPFGVVASVDVPQLATAVAALVLAAAVSRPVRRLWRSKQARRIELPAFALLAVTAAAVVGASDRAGSLLGAPGSGLGALMIATLLLLGLSAAWTAPQVRAALIVVAPWILAGQVAFTVFQLVTGAPPQGTFTSGAYLSMAVVLLIPATIAPVVAGGKLRYDRRSAVRLSLSGAAVVLLGIAGMRIGTAVALAAVAWMLTPEVRRLSKDDRRTVPAIVGALVLTVVAGVLVLVRVLGTTPVTELLGPRRELWTGSLHLVALRPLLGWAPDSFRTALGLIAPAALVSKAGAGGYGFNQLPADPYNLVLAVLVSLGVLGAAVSLWMSVAALRTWLGERRSSGRLSWPAVSTVLFLATAMLSSAGLEVLPLFVLVLGASAPLGFLRVEAADGRRTFATTAGSSAAWLSRTVAIAGTLVVAASAVTHVWMGPSRQSADVGTSLRAQRVAQLWQVDPFLYNEESVRWSLTAAGGDSSAFTPAVTAARRSVMLAPSDPYYRTQYAYTLYVTDDLLGAVAEYEQALALFPQSPDAVEGLGYSLLAAGMPGQARPYADRAVVLGPERVTAHLLASDVYRALGDQARADKEAAAAQALRAK